MGNSLLGYGVTIRDTETREELRDDLREWARNRLVEYGYPRDIEFVDDLPKMSPWKIRRVALRERDGIE